MNGLDIIPLATNQVLTGAWVDAGPEFCTEKITNLLIWVDVIINNSQNFRIRLLAKQTNGATEEFYIPIRTVSPSVNRIQQEYVEFTEDIDQHILADATLQYCVPWMQLQTMAEIPGLIPGVLNASLTVTRGGN